jgi:hypothetical protein
MGSGFIFTLDTALLVDVKAGPPVSNAVSILRRDMGKTLAAAGAKSNTIRIRSPESEMPAESWIIKVEAGEITVRGGDSLGCVYALLYMSENFLGVRPFWFWNDQCFIKQASVSIPRGIIRSTPHAVRYRGWFVNDEVLIENWAAEPANREHWAFVFETLLRCGGNMIVPGTDGNSRKYRSLAADMGFRITHHHAEPLGAEMLSRAYPGETPSYALNRKLFEQLWEQAVIEQKKYKVIWGLGYRGQGDCPFWESEPDCVTGEQRGKRISDVIRHQYEIITRHVENPVCCINVYGEITELYQGGYISLPPGLIKVWSDNGYGCMVSRRQGDHNPRIHSLPSANDTGPHGIYFHTSFHDLQASNHLTMSPNSAEFLAAELEKALEAGAGEYWTINCGSVKPQVYMLDMVSELWRTGHIDVDEWRLRYAAAYYGKENAKAVAALFAEYASCTAKYGPNEDDRAGEQIWHHPVRELLCLWMSRSDDTQSRVKSLIWLSGEASFSEQVQKLETICRKGLPLWDAFCEHCAAIIPTLTANSLRLFNDTVFLQGRLQRNGAAGALAFCESFRAQAAGDGTLAFLLAKKSHSFYAEGVKVLAEAEHDEWAGYYQGDCLTDIRLTASCLDALVSYLRVIGDGPDFHKWERNFLTPPGERNIMLLSSKQRALTNDELAAGLGSALGKP